MALLAGFDIGGTTARMRVFDDEWTPVADRRSGTREILEPTELAELMADMLADATDEPIEAVGVGIASQLDDDGRVIANAPSFGWTDVPFAELLESTLAESSAHSDHPPTIRLVNDLSALLWGECRAGAARGHLDTLAVYVGTGVGGAILADGRLIEGVGGKAGEIGHAKVAPGGRLCGCGQRGCVEAYAGGAHLERRVIAVARDRDIDALRDESASQLAGAEARLDSVQELDDIWDEATDYLAVTIANAVTLLNPGALLLGGGVIENLAEFRTRLLTKITPLMSASARDDLVILSPELGDQAGVLGAAMLARALRSQ